MTPIYQAVVDRPKTLEWNEALQLDFQAAKKALATRQCYIGVTFLC